MKKRCTIGLLVILTLGVLVAPLPGERESGGTIARIGLLTTTFPSSEEQHAFEQPWRQALRDLGWVEGQNIAFEWRFAEGDLDRLPALAAELVQLKVDLIVAGTTRAIRAAQQATSTIPIVMGSGGDPVREGFVTSLSPILLELTAKRLELLKDAVPGVSRVGVLTDPTGPNTPTFVRETERAARALRVELSIVELTDPHTLEAAFATITQARVEALMVLPSPRLTAQTRRIVDLAARHQLPAIYYSRQFVEAGGLMSYRGNEAERFRRLAIYVDKILKGAKPADLPVEQPTTFELVINLKTAKALGLTIPPSLLFQADEVVR